jgi:hypothetical protein
MTINTGSHPKSLWPGVKAFFGKTYAEKPAVWSQVFESMSSDKNYEEVVEYTGFGLAPQKSEGASVSYDTDAQGPTTRFSNVVYGLGAVITREAIEDNQYESVASKKAAGLARSMRQTKENVHANILNRAFTSGYVGGDGVVLGSTAHPTHIGSQSNILAVAADFSEASMEDMLILIRQAKDSRGLRIQLQGTKLVVPPTLVFEATRVVSSTNQSGTANNDTNASKALGMLPGGIVTWDYLTDDDAWFILTDAPDGLLSFQRRKLELTQDNDFDTENARMKATERYVPGWGDWRGIFCTPGA